MSVIVTILLAISGLFTSPDSATDDQSPTNTPTEILTDEGGAG